MNIEKSLKNYTSMPDKSINNNVLWIRERFPWMGQHSGYDQLFSCIEKFNLLSHHISTWRESNKLPPKGLRKILRLMFINHSKSPVYDLASARAEISGIYQILSKKPQLVHITYLENNMSRIPFWGKRLSFKTIGTAHQPESWWESIHRQPEVVSSLDALIVPAKKELKYFKQFLPNRVFFIPHGIDTDFFHPHKISLPKSEKRIVRCVYAGKWLRDIKTMADVIDKILKKNPKIHFDLIIPREKSPNPLIHQIFCHEQVSWLHGLSDKQLRRVYQQADILVLPLLDCTANNVILEAMASGLPIVTTDVGGIRDYTSNTFADLLPEGDSDGMTDAILKLAENTKYRTERGDSARSHSIKYFQWARIANKTIEVYQRIIDS